MYKAFFFIMLLLLGGCRTKKNVAETHNRQVQNTKVTTTQATQQKEVIFKTTFQSADPHIPVEYIHEKDGKIVEKITVKGGSLIHSAESRITQSQTAEQQEAQQIIEQHQKEAQKQARTFFLGSWLWLILLIVILFIVKKCYERFLRN